MTFTITPGLHPHVPEDEYHADKTHLSASAAKTLLGKREPGDSWALRFGSLVHMMLLEPSRFDRDYVTLDPNVHGLNAKGEPTDAYANTTNWKRAVKAVEAEGKRVASDDDVRRARAMVEAVKAHPTAATLLDLATDTELSAYGVNSTLAAEGVAAPVRGRFDLIGPGFVADVKTTGDADPSGGKGFRFGLTNFGYHLSAANYLDLAQQHDRAAEVFVFINVERDPTPAGVHRVSVCQLTAEALDKGRADMAKACRLWLDNNKTVTLPDYGTGFHTVDLLPWAYADNAGDYEELGESE